MRCAVRKALLSGCDAVRIAGLAECRAIGIARLAGCLTRREAVGITRLTR